MKKGSLGKWGAILLGALPAIGLYLFIYYWVGGAALRDPDHYYHLALARETVASGSWFLSKVPQIVGIGWNQIFPDKEFLFHLVNRFLYSAAGETGVLLAVPLYAVGTLVLLSAILRRHIGVLGITMLLVFFILLDPWLRHRFFMVRPHMLAIFLFFALVLALLRRSAGWAFTLGALYSLSYHTFYVPLIALLVFGAAVGSWSMSRFRIAVWGGLGVLAGLILNPHFPSNLVMSFRHLMIALFEADTQGLDFGGELYPWSTSRFLRVHALSILLVIGAPWMMRSESGSSSRAHQDGDFLWVWVLSAVFLLLSFQSPRALEYAVPIFVIVAGMVASGFKMYGKGATAALVAVVLFFGSTRVSEVYHAVKSSAHPLDRPQSLLVEFLRGLPAKSKESSGPIGVFNVEWDQSPQVYYASPRFEFLDILDPSFLSTSQPRLHQIRWAMRRGQVLDPWGVVKTQKQSKYLISRHPILNGQLARDIQFRRVFPAPTISVDPGVPQVFELLEERDPHFVTDWRMSPVLRSGSGADADGLSFQSSAPAMNVTPRHEAPVDQGEEQVKHRLVSSFVDFRNSEVRKLLALEGVEGAEKSTVSCVLAEPSEAERAKQQGKNVIALGGSRSFRVWINGKRVFHSVAARDGIDPMDRLVRLSSPLRTTDRVQTLVCSVDSSREFSVAMSFWSAEELQQACADRGWKPVAAASAAKVWPVRGNFSETCFGSYLRTTTPIGAN